MSDVYRRVKENSVITLQVHSDVYENLAALAVFVSEPEALVDLKETDPNEFKSYLENLVLILENYEANAEEAGLIEIIPESEITDEMRKYVDGLED